MRLSERSILGVKLREHGASMCSVECGASCSMLFHVVSLYLLETHAENESSSAHCCYPARQQWGPCLLGSFGF